MIIALFITGGALKYKGLDLTYDIGSFFSKESSAYQNYQDFTSKYGREMDFLLIGIEDKELIFKPAILKNIDAFSKKLKKDERVKKVITPTRFKNFIFSENAGNMSLPLLHLNDSVQLNKDVELLYSIHDYNRQFFSNDRKSLCLYVQIANKLSPNESKVFLKEVRSTLDDFGINNYYLSGRPRTQEFYKDTVKEDMMMFAIISVTLIVLALFFVFRSFVGVVVPFVILIVSVVICLGLLSMFEISLNLLMTLLPTLIFIIGVSDIIHFIKHYISERLLGKNKLEAIQDTFKIEGKAIFVTSFTTAVGMFALAFSGHAPLQLFGIVSALCILITYAICVLLLPALLIFLPNNAFLGIGDRNTKFDFRFANLASFVIKNRVKILFISLLAILIVLPGIRKINIQTYFLDDLLEKSTLKKELTFFENNYGGIRPFEILVRPSSESQEIMSSEFLNELDVLENYVKDNYSTEHVISFASVVKKINQSVNGGANKYFRFPSDSIGCSVVSKLIKKYGKRTGITLADNDFRELRISARIADYGSVEVERKNNKLIAFAEEKLKLFTIHLTGAAYLMEQTNKDIVWSILSGLSISLLLVFLCLWWFLKSFKLALISLIPNLIPLIILGGMLGWLGIDLKVTTSVIFVLILGIAVDDTVHVLNGYKKSNVNDSFQDRIKFTMGSLGLPILYTTIILGAGFLSFTQSSFTGVYSIGLMTSIGLIVAFLYDIFLLPVLLYYFDRKK